MNITDAADLVSLLTNGALTSLDTMVSKRTGGSNGNPQYVDIRKVWRTAGAAQTNPSIGQWHSLWTSEGIPCFGSAPGAFANPTRATAGAMGQDDATGGRQLRLFSASMLSSQAGMLVLYDRLMHVSGLSGTVTTAQNLNGGSPAGVTRYTTGERNEIWVEIYTALGSTATTITASYTDQSGNAAASIPTVVGGSTRNESGRIVRCSLASGDYGVRDITSVTLAASTLTAGDFGVVIARPLMYIPISITNAGVACYFATGNFPKIEAGACLAWAFVGTTTTPPVVDGLLEFMEV